MLTKLHITFESAKLRAWLARMLGVLTCLRAHVLGMFTCLRAYLLAFLACLCACVLTCLACLRACVLGALAFLACLCVCVLTCLRFYLINSFICVLLIGKILVCQLKNTCTWILGQNSCLEDRVISSLFCIQSNFWKEQSGQ